MVMGIGLAHANGWRLGFMMAAAWDFTRVVCTERDVWAQTKV